jgi:thiamine monophosphate synthase
VGSAGIAVMGALMRALDPEWTASALAEAFEAAVGVR